MKLSIYFCARILGRFLVSKDLGQSSRIYSFKPLCCSSRSLPGSWRRPRLLKLRRRVLCLSLILPQINKTPFHLAQFVKVLKQSPYPLWLLQYILLLIRQVHSLYVFHLRNRNHLNNLNNFHHLLHTLRRPYKLCRQWPPRRLPPSKPLFCILLHQLPINDCKYCSIIAHLLKLYGHCFVISERFLKYEFMLAHYCLNYVICLLKVAVYLVYH